MVFVKTFFYTGINLAGIQISEIIRIRVVEKGSLHFLIMVGGKGIIFSKLRIKWLPGSTELIFRVVFD